MSDKLHGFSVSEFSAIPSLLTVVQADLKEVEMSFPELGTIQSLLCCCSLPVLHLSVPLIFLCFSWYFKPLQVRIFNALELRRVSLFSAVHQKLLKRTPSAVEYVAN